MNERTNDFFSDSHLGNLYGHFLAAVSLEGKGGAGREQGRETETPRPL